MKSTISKYYKDKGSIGIYNDSDELCHIDLGDGKFKEVKTIEESIAKHLRLGNDFRSPARKGFIQEDNINKEGFLISSRPSVLLPVLNDRGLNLIGRM